MRRWVVSITKRPAMDKPWPWRPDYFPRGFAYKVNANIIKKQVERLGGQAEVKPVDEQERLDK